MDTGRTPYTEFYKNTVQKWIDQKLNFTIIKDNSRLTIYRDNKIPSIYHLPNVVIGEGINRGYHLCSLVKKEIAKINLDKLLKKKPKSIYFNWFDLDNIKNTQSSEYIYQIDIFACYWYIARKLNFISEHLFKRGLINNEYKHGRNAAIGALASSIDVRKYRNGECIEVAYKEKDSKIIRDIIANDALMLSVDVYKRFKKHILFFETDCFFTTGNKYNSIIEFIKSKGFESEITKTYLKDYGIDKTGSVAIITSDKKYMYDKSKNIKEILNNI